MFLVRRKTVEALFEAQEPRLKNRLRLDVSPSSRAESLRGPLDVETAMAAIGERTLQVMGGFADDKVIESSTDSSVVLMPGPDSFEKPLERRLKQGFGLDQSPGSLHSQTALQLLGEDFSTWVEKTPQEAEDYSIFTEAKPAFRICMRCEPFPALNDKGDRKTDDIQSVDPFKPTRREPGATG